MPALLLDPSFYIVSFVAVALVGIAKGGFGGTGAVVAVPLMSLVVPPVQAAAITLPILVVMDIVSLWSWRGTYDRKTLANMLPGAMLGIAIGWATAALVPIAAVKLIIGLLALAFVARYVMLRRRPAPHVRSQSAAAGNFWGTISGYTSFVAHAGGAPYQVYAMGLGHSPALYVGTSVIFFAVVNAVKLVPYLALGQFDRTNLIAAAVLLPVAPIATLAGAWLTRRLSPAVFYLVLHIILLAVGLKLTFDGLVDVMA